jgi:oxygen-independent coproporphyrinogen-3 oxidase
MMGTAILADLQATEFDADLMRRYDRPGSCYTAYPAADRFVEAFDAQRYQAEAAATVLAGSRNHALYVHLPFCQTDCVFCACDKVVSRDRGDGDRYLDYLEREVALQRRLFGHAPIVTQLYLGGGSPTFLRDDQLIRLADMLAKAFPIDPAAELSIEVDPRQLGSQTLPLLSELGFSRLSIGVQDLDPTVQRAISCIHPAERTAAVLAESRRLGFKSVGVDLFYGLPRQTCDSMERTMSLVRQWRPDRVSLYGYVHQPERFRSQRHMDASVLPSAVDRLALLDLASKQLSADGYLFIGMNQFALPDDELANALCYGRLHRGLLGYSIHPDCDLIALGVAAVGKVGNTYSQNHRSLDEYIDALDHGYLPIARGLVLSADDMLRRAVIMALLCQSELSFEAIETAWMIDFNRYFAQELAVLQRFCDDGLLSIERDALIISPRGRPVAQAIALVFDRYARSAQSSGRFSRII